MKHLKKLASLALALVMVMALAAPAWAEDVTYDTHKIIVTQETDETKPTHELTVWQIFKGNGAVTDPTATPPTKSTEKFDPESLAWGSAFLTEAEQKAFVDAMRANTVLKPYFDAVMGNVTSYTAEDVAQCLYVPEQVRDNVAKAVAAEAYKILGTETGRGFTLSNRGESLANQERTMEDGYYVIRDHIDGVDDVMVASPMLGANLTVNLKNEKPEDTEPDVVKKIQDPVTKEWVDYTEHDIGDMVKFQITATLPAGYEEETDFWLTFSDTQDNGFGVPDEIKVYAMKGENHGEKEVLYPLDPQTSSKCFPKVTGNDFTVDIQKMKENDPFKNYKSGDMIVIEYEAELLENAVIGGVGNKNKVELTYKGGKDESTVTDFTFELQVDKTDGDTGKPLIGASFKLYKQMPKADGTGNEWVDVDEITGITVADKDGTTVETGSVEAGTRFEFKGLTKGFYMLEETKVPKDYNKAAPIYLKVDTDYGYDTNNVLTIKKLTIVQTDAEGNVGANAQEKDGNKETGTVNDTVVNNKGVQLPSTGGIGTTIFYIVGGVLLVGAVVLLIAKRRTSADEE